MGYTAIAWTMKNALTDVPPGLRGPVYQENRLLVIGNVLVINVVIGNAVTGEHTVGVYADNRSAHAEAISITQTAEESGYRMDGTPRTYEVGEGLYTRLVDKVGNEFNGPNEFLDSLYFLVLNGGKDAA